MTTPPYFYKKVMPNTTRKKMLLVAISCTKNVSSLMATSNNVLPNEIRGLSTTLRLKTEWTLVVPFKKVSSIVFNPTGL